MTSWLWISFLPSSPIVLERRLALCRFRRLFQFHRFQRSAHGAPHRAHEIRASSSTASSLGNDVGRRRGTRGRSRRRATERHHHRVGVRQHVNHRTFVAQAHRHRRVRGVLTKIGPLMASALFPHDILVALGEQHCDPVAVTGT